MGNGHLRTSCARRSCFATFDCYTHTILLTLLYLRGGTPLEYLLVFTRLIRRRGVVIASDGQRVSSVIEYHTAYEWSSESVKRLGAKNRVPYVFLTDDAQTTLLKYRVYIIPGMVYVQNGTVYRFYVDFFILFF